MGRLLAATLAGNPAGGATPPPTPPSGHTGVEFAELITGFTAQAGVGPTGTPNGINIDIAAMGGPQFNFNLGWTNPTGFQPWMRSPYGGLALYVSFYGMSPLPNGPVPPSHAGYPIAAVFSGSGQNIWAVADIFATSSTPASFNQLGQGGTQLEDGQTYDLILWAVSMDSNGNQNTFAAAVTPNLEITWAWPLGSAPTAAKYTDNVSSFALGTPVYVVNGAGQKVLRIPASWTPPGDARYGGITITYSKGLTGAISIAVPCTLAGSVNIDLPVPQASDLTGGNVPWYFYAVAQDTNGNLNSSLTIAPVSGTPFATVTPSGPAGGSGVEFTSLVASASISQALIKDANGVSTRFITATFTTPNDPTFGGVELRIYNSGTHSSSTRVGSQKTASPGLSTAWFIIMDLPDPTASVSWQWELVSYDVNGNFNTEQSGTPHGSFTVGASSGLDGAFLQALSVGTAAIANLAVTNAKVNDLAASKLTAGTIVASISIQVTGSGVITDILQGTDATTGSVYGIRIENVANVARIVIGPSRISFINSSGVIISDLLTASPSFPRWSMSDPTTANNVVVLSATSHGGVVLAATPGAGVSAAEMGVDASGFGYTKYDNSSSSFGLRCQANRKMLADNNGVAAQLSGGQITITLPFQTVVDSVVAIAVASAEAMEWSATGTSGGFITVTIKSITNPTTSTAFISWMATGF